MQHIYTCIFFKFPCVFHQTSINIKMTSFLANNMQHLFLMQPNSYLQHAFTKINTCKNSLYSAKIWNTICMGFLSFHTNSCAHPRTPTSYSMIPTYSFLSFLFFFLPLVVFFFFLHFASCLPFSFGTLPAKETQQPLFFLFCFLSPFLVTISY